MALEPHYHSLLHPVVREALDETRKGDSLRFAPAADGFDDVRSEIGQTDDARDVGRSQSKLFRKIAQVGRPTRNQHVRPLPGVANGADDDVLFERHAIPFRNDDIAVSANAFQLELHRELNPAVIQHPLFHFRQIFLRDIVTLREVSADRHLLRQLLQTFDTQNQLDFVRRHDDVPDNELEEFIPRGGNQERPQTGGVVQRGDNLQFILREKISIIIHFEKREVLLNLFLPEFILKYRRGMKVWYVVKWA